MQHGAATEGKESHQVVDMLQLHALIPSRTTFLSLPFEVQEQILGYHHLANAKCALWYGQRTLLRASRDAALCSPGARATAR
jgi:hypothetical protein